MDSLLGLAAILVCPGGASAASDGVNGLVGLSQMKASTSNNKALRATAFPASPTVLKSGGLTATKYQSSGTIRNARQTQAVKAALGSKAKDRESQDKIDNFQVNNLMSDRNRQESLSSNVQKKLDNTKLCKGCF